MGRLGLDLEGLTVLTEAATGNYALTAAVAALAGADEVLLLSRDSRFGSADEAVGATMAVARDWGLDGRLRLLTGREDLAMGRADVITNLGFVRPIDRSMVARLKAGAVVPLMFEAWEYRAEDVDLEACRLAGIPVAGTDESDPRLGIFDYLGPVALRLLFELEIEVVRSSILVLGGGPFAPPVVAALEANRAQVRRFDPLDSRTASTDLTGLDAIMVLEHRFREPVLGTRGSLSVDALATASPGVVVAHIAGQIDADALRTRGIAVHPMAPAPAGYMSVATDYVGPRPVIDLHAAGLRVGHALVEAVRAGYDGMTAATAAALRCPLVQPLDAGGADDAAPRTTNPNAE